MNVLIQQKNIDEIPCGSNVSYILNQEENFSSTEYKVLQSRENSCFVPCMKTTFNGKIQLYYVTGKLKTLTSFLPSLNAENFATVASNLLSDILDIMQNGFLSVQNIDLSFEHVYVDPFTFKVGLLYLPLKDRIYEDYVSFENAIRVELKKVVSENFNLQSPKTMQFASDLSNGNLSLEDVYNHLKGIRTAETVPTQTEIGYVPEVKSAGILKLVAMNAPTHVEISITKPCFKIGKKPELCDGVVTFNKMISRLHCEIQSNGGSYTIMDLQSANGTYVNRVRLLPNQPYVLNVGDIVRLANSDFQVVLE